MTFEPATFSIILTNADRTGSGIDTWWLGDAQFDESVCWRVGTTRLERGSVVKYDYGYGNVLLLYRTRLEGKSSFG